MKLIQALENIIATGLIKYDARQRFVAEQLQALNDCLEKRPPVNILDCISRLWRQSSSDSLNKGIYLWGGVGSGKTMLMDLFYQYTSIAKKERWHFSAFMLKVHRDLHELKNQGISSNLLSRLCSNWSRELQLLCLDEFQVLDVADAMILRGVLEGFLDQKVTLVITSNRPPRDLYLNGVHRSSFMPCIEMLERRLKVLHLDSGQDYRQAQDLPSLESAVFISPVNKETDAQVESIYNHLSNGRGLSSYLEIMGRSIFVRRNVPDLVAWFTFGELCESPMSAVDYSAIVSAFPKIIISNVPIIRDADIARRFIVLLDLLYDGHVKLILQSKVPFLQIFDRSALSGSKEEIFALDRTLSRLTEMSSTVWWSQKPRQRR